MIYNLKIKIGSIIYIRKRSGFLKHLTIKNCDKTFRKSILKFIMKGVRHRGLK